MIRRLLRRMALVARFALIASVVFTVSACAPQEEVSTTDDASVSDETATVDTTGDADAVWLSGAWDVEATLDVISSALFEEAAGQGAVVAVIEVSGDGSMTLSADDVDFTGGVVFGGDAFRFEGEAEYVDEDGVPTRSDIIINGVRTGEDTWEGDMYGVVASDGEFQYEANWLQSAVRRP